MAERLGRPSGFVARQQQQLAQQAQRLRHAVLLQLQRLAQVQQALEADLPIKFQHALRQRRQRLEHSAVRLQLLDPRLVLQRGYVLLTDAQGRAVTSVQQAAVGASLRAVLVDGALDVVVQPQQLALH